ncbi:marvel domain-containing protein [Podospora didyma]|uniref:Marvel domain-containing protein n=1 Tax=Podospora didyma TaxID=330526 RepID=A0AAE0K565_9PEZI|nr:marvel domain-containing protein [Podospora didyma]
MDPMQLLLRGLQLLWIVLLTALIGNVIVLNINGAMAAINFSMFVIVVSWLACLFGLFVALVQRFDIPGKALFIADIVASLFTFIGAVVLAAKLRAVNCADTADWGEGWIAYGSLNDTKRCREIQASAVFMWFLFGTFVAGLVLSWLGFRRSGGSVMSAGPSMSQFRGGV